MKLSTLSTKVLKFFKKHTIDTITTPIEEVIENEITKIKSQKIKQNYISRVLIMLYNNGEYDAVFYLSNKYRHDS